MGLYPIDCSECKKPFMWFSGLAPDQRCAECRQIPIQQSLWTDCLYELMEKAKSSGAENVEFSDVDKLVIEKSKSIVQYKFR